MVRTRLAVPFLLLSACASPRAITELGPEPALALVSAQLQTQDGDSVQLDVDIARAVGLLDRTGDYLR